MNAQSRKRRFLQNGPSKSQRHWASAPFSQPGSLKEHSHLWGEGWGPGDSCWGGEEGAEPCTAHSDMLCLFSFEIIPCRARGWVRPSWACALCGKKDREPCPGNGGMLEGGAAGWWGPPPLPAWLPLLSHALPWLAALGWNKHRDAHRAQDEQHSPLSSADTGTTVPIGTATLHAGLCSQSRNQWATLFPFSNFSLVKWSTCWSCVFNLPDIEATTTSPSALSQHRKPIKTRKKHKLQTGRPRVAQSCCLQAVSYNSDSFQCELVASDKAKTERRLFTAF